jgi:hypothetical protein
VSDTVAGISKVTFLRPRVGVEVTPTRVRAIRVGGLAASRTAETAWDPARPRDAVDALRATLGGTGSVAVAVGLGFLQVKHVELPPVPAEERARMVALEPERYFAQRDTPLVVSLMDSNLAFAAPGDALASWVAAFEEWAPVVRVEAAPLALARALGSTVSGTFSVDAGEGETGLVELRDGSLVSARRIPALESSLNRRVTSHSSPVTSPFAVALGAARGADEPVATLLAPSEIRERIAWRIRRRMASAIGVCALSVGFALWAADTWRERTLHSLQARVSAVEGRVGPANAALQSLLALETESQTIQRLERQRPDPFAALARVGVVLPHDAVLLSAKATGNDWQIDGTARDASALVPLFDKDGAFDGARFLSATSRYREANRFYETFSLALRYQPRP